MQEFAHGDSIEVVWHSFQLDPDTKTQPGKDVYSYLAERKGQSLEWSRQAHKHVTDMAARAGLQYNFDKAVVANSFDAHRVLQLAKKHSKGDAMEDQLFKGYFTEGKNIADHDVLADMAVAVGIEKQVALDVLKSDAYSAEVQADIETAARIGINGVPFFVINNKYGVSGAQPASTFVQALNRAWEEYAKEKGGLTMMDGEAASCEPGGECE
jgi:predicted DsbA family dithiol-disulfide isomerase